MAGDWIKMRADLFTHPKVVRISSALKADTLRTVGGIRFISIQSRRDGNAVYRVTRVIGTRIPRDRA